MRTTLATAIVAWTLVSPAHALVAQPHNETPRATDLLRAERLADEVRRRLDLPPVRAEGGWLHGGQGWPRRTAGPGVATDGDVIINVKPSRSSGSAR